MTIRVQHFPIVGSSLFLFVTGLRIGKDSFVEKGRLPFIYYLNLTFNFRTGTSSSSFQSSI
jgi:hypothetical protein